MSTSDMDPTKIASRQPRSIEIGVQLPPQTQLGKHLLEQSRRPCFLTLDIGIEPRTAESIYTPNEILRRRVRVRRIHFAALTIGRRVRELCIPVCPSARLQQDGFPHFLFRWPRVPRRLNTQVPTKEIDSHLTAHIAVTANPVIGQRNQTESTRQSYRRRFGPQLGSRFRVPFTQTALTIKLMLRRKMTFSLTAH
ncbi:hypothetical protein AWB98_02525 [Mycolicibacterium conceptionense]|uniref:Uncharacterized protein n=1 Tax=Mycolicibacterium conceptionense TaxID=451644 RepID=A0ABX3UZV8_9MYCO|nr:hypothetical protein AWB98_02525 [Mycolicibacterium conceptionense]